MLAFKVLPNNNGFIRIATFVKTQVSKPEYKQFILSVVKSVRHLRHVLENGISEMWIGGYVLNHSTKYGAKVVLFSGVGLYPASESNKSTR